MDRISRLVLLIALLLPAAAAAQHPRDDRRGSSYAFGYEYSPWQNTAWNALQYRTKCEGEQVRGMETGPIKWLVDFRNQATDLLSFNYVIAPPGTNKVPAASGRGKAKPGKSWTRLAVVSTTRCDDGVVVKMDKIRIGPDVDSVAYRRPDHPEKISP